MDLSIFIGAGFSKWAANLPLANQLFDFHINAWQRENKRLKLIQDWKLEWDTLHPNSYAEKFITHIFNQGTDKQRQLLRWYIVRRLSDPFIVVERKLGGIGHNRYNLAIDDTEVANLAGVATARNFLQRWTGVDLKGIITTNYDLLIEYALGPRLFNYGQSNQILEGTRRTIQKRNWKSNKVLLTGKIPLAKLHGSVSWGIDAKYYLDGRKAITGDALIIPPIEEKSPHPTMESVWELGGKILRESSFLVVFGFSFNEYDKAVLSLLADNGKNLKEILLIDIAPNIAAVSKLWPDALITSCAPHPNDEKIIAKWRMKWLSAN